MRHLSEEFEYYRRIANDPSRSIAECYDAQRRAIEIEREAVGRNPLPPTVPILTSHYEICVDCKTATRKVIIQTANWRFDTCEAKRVVEEKHKAECAKIEAELAARPVEPEPEELAIRWTDADACRRAVEREAYLASGGASYDWKQMAKVTRRAP